MIRNVALGSVALSLLVLGCVPASSVAPSAEAPSPAAEATASPAPTPAAPIPSLTASPPVPPPSPPAAPASAWTKLDLAGPSPREDHTWTVDGSGRYAYLFGGRAGSKSRGDLWRYDLRADAWERLQPQGPRPDARFGHAAIWAEGVGLVIWAGQAGAAFFDDLWAFDPIAGAWRRLPSRGAVPEARYGSCAVLGGDGRIWISHGFTDQGRFFDTRAYDIATGRWTDATPAKGPRPVERCLHDCLWVADGRLLLYAGQTTGVPALADLWAFDPATDAWAEIEPDPRPSARQLYALAVAGETAWVLGGAGKDRGKLDDLWTLDLGTLAWRPVDVAGVNPSGRAGATLIADPNQDRLLLFGGIGGKGELGDTWQLAPAATD